MNKTGDKKQINRTRRITAETKGHNTEPKPRKQREGKQRTASMLPQSYRSSRWGHTSGPVYSRGIGVRAKGFTKGDAIAHTRRRNSSQKGNAIVPIKKANALRNSST